MKTENTGPYALRKRLHDATQAASEKLAKMTKEERREAGRRAYLKFINKEF